MDHGSAIPPRARGAVVGAAGAGLVGLMLLGLSPATAGAAAGSIAVDPASFDTAAMGHRTRRISNDAGQYYMAWWLPGVMVQAIARDKLNLAQPETDQLVSALQPYLVFALSRGQVGAQGLADVHDRADLLKNSRLSVDGQALTAVPADQIEAGTQSALDRLRPALSAMVGRNGGGIQFALYRVPGTMPVEPTAPGIIDYDFYRKKFQWRLPLWSSPATVALHAAPAALPVVPAAAGATAAGAAAAAAVSSPGPAVSPAPVQHRKIDPTTGEEFPERYDYNPYTGQKLITQ